MNSFKRLITAVSKGQPSEAFWKRHTLQGLIEVIPKSKILKLHRQLYKLISKCHGMKTLRPAHLLQTLVELLPKSDGLEATWQRDPGQVFIETIIERQSLKPSWQKNTCQTYQPQLFKT